VTLTVLDSTFGRRIDEIIFMDDLRHAIEITEGSSSAVRGASM
jgi:hypothetical protein